MVNISNRIDSALLLVAAVIIITYDDGLLYSVPMNKWGVDFNFECEKLKF